MAAALARHFLFSSPQWNGCVCGNFCTLAQLCVFKVWWLTAFEHFSLFRQIQNHPTVIESSAAESGWWPSPPVLQLTQSVLPVLNMLCPHSVSCFHGSDVEVGIPDWALFWVGESVGKGEMRENVNVVSLTHLRCHIQENMLCKEMFSVFDPLVTH